MKVALFLLSGNLLHVYGTKRLSKLTGVLSGAPTWGILLAAGTFAAAGSPPFGAFLSEWLLLRDAFAAREILAAVVVIVGLTITFIALATHIGGVLFGTATHVKHPAPIRQWSVTPAVLLGLSLLTGLMLTPTAMSLLTALAAGGGR